jgi:hypothetical protein
MGKSNCFFNREIATIEENGGIETNTASNFSFFNNFIATFAAFLDQKILLSGMKNVLLILPKNFIKNEEGILTVPLLYKIRFGVNDSVLIILTSEFKASVNNDMS